MRGEKIVAILEGIGQIPGAMADFAAAFLAVGYNASFSRLQFEIDKRQSMRDGKRVLNETQQQERQRYYNLVMHLKRDGLIAERVKKKRRFLELTTKGILKLSQLKKQIGSVLPMPQYRKVASSQILIVSFDVPERDRRKRAWLRSALKNLGFKMVQQSLWVGRVKLPEEFLVDLQRLRLVEAVEIFEVSKLGSLEHII